MPHKRQTTYGVILFLFWEDSVVIYSLLQVLTGKKNVRNKKGWAVSIFDSLTKKLSNTLRYETIRYDTLQYFMMRYDTIHYDTIPYDTVQYNTV